MDGLMGLSCVGLILSPARPLIHFRYACSGASGYGRFGIENFTDKRTMILHPKGRKYPLVA
jgi:hypothetical protein